MADNWKQITFSLTDKEGKPYPERTSKNGKRFIAAKLQGDYQGQVRFYPDSGFYSISLTPRLSVEDKIQEGIAKALAKMK